MRVKVSPTADQPLPAGVIIAPEIGMPRHRNEDRPKDLLFIDESQRQRSTPAGQRRRRDATTRLIISHARRVQTGTKNQARLASAQQGALYARSLIGWRYTRAQTQTPVTEPVRTNIEPNFPAGEDEDANDHEGNIGLVIQDWSLQFIPNQVVGGLRTDPFGAYPAQTSKLTMHMVDYRE